MTQAVEYTLSERDYVRFSGFVFARNTSRFRFPLMRRIALIGLVTLAAFQVVTRWRHEESLADWTDFAVVFSFVYLLAFPLIMRWTAARNFRSAPFAKMREPTQLEISPDGVRSRGGVGESAIPWSAIIDIDVDADAGYLFLFKNNALIVPRHAFAEDAEFDQFVVAARGYRDAAGAAST